MTEHLYASWGGLTLPIPDSAVDGSNLNLTDLDPLTAQLVGLFAQAIRSELTTVWSTVCAALPTDHPLRGSTDPVADTLEQEPSSDVLRERKTAWPLLAVHRTGEVEFDERGDQVEQWLVHYILGPRQGVVEDRKLGAALPTVARIISLAVEEKSHPDYQSGALCFFGDTLADEPLARMISVKGWNVGTGKFTDEERGPVYPALLLSLNVLEGFTWNAEAYGPCTGMYVHVHGGDAEQLVPDLVIADTDHVG